MPDYGTCEKCGLPITAVQTPAYPVTGWEIGRSGGGANAIRLRRRVPNRVRHNTCLPDAAEAAAAQQQELFGHV